MPKIKFVVEHQNLDVKAGRNVREVALEAGIYPNREFFRGFNCGGRGLCGTCKVWVHELSNEATSKPNGRERFHGMGDGRRLACQTIVRGDVEVSTMPGGDDRLATNRSIDPAPRRPPDPEPPTKPAEKSPEKAPEKSPEKFGAKPVAKKGAAKKGETTKSAKADGSEPADDKADATKTDNKGVADEDDQRAESKKTAEAET